MTGNPILRCIVNVFYRNVYFCSASVTLEWEIRLASKMTFLSPANAQLVNPNWQSGPGGTIPANAVYSYDSSARSNYFAGYTPASLQMSGTVYDKKLADGATTQMGISDGSSGSGMGFSISGSVDPKGIGPISFSMASHVDDQPFAFAGKGPV